MFRGFLAMMSMHKWHPIPCNSSLASSSGWASLTRHKTTQMLEYLHHQGANRPPLLPPTVMVRGCHVDFVPLRLVLRGHRAVMSGASNTTSQQGGLGEANFCSFLVMGKGRFTMVMSDTVKMG